jgi:hypothetical protein
MLQFMAETSSDGVRERDFTVGEAPACSGHRRPAPVALPGLPGLPGLACLALARPRPGPAHG